ncbi:MAG TPA: peptidase M16 [Microscillaceae bacterium]|nr:peptidase M16 [Microscillaceae bacterium]
MKQKHTILPLEQSVSSHQMATLPNGIRVVHRQVPYTKIAHCGFVLNIGSRDEKPNQLGLAHFWEHMAFKGTQKRKAFHILNSIDAVGGELNAYTTKEKICFYASFLDVYFEKAVELLTDITFHSTFPENQIDRERNVILEEMAMYADSPDDSLQDDFDALVFQNHPLGTNILGTQDSIKQFGKQDFQQFIAENLDTSEVIFASVGNFPFSKALKIAEKYIQAILPSKAKRRRQKFEQYLPTHKTQNISTGQAYCAMGLPAFSLYDERRTVFGLLVNLLGGPGMNSRLNLNLRERHGLVYGVEAAYTPFLDTGLFGIYFNTEPKQLEKSIQLIWKEIKTLKEQKLGVVQLQQAKDQLCGQLAMAEESNLNYMLMMGKSMLDLGKIEPIEQIFEAIQQITATAICDLANEIWSEDKFCVLKYIPEENVL